MCLHFIKQMNSDFLCIILTQMHGLCVQAMYFHSVWLQSWLVLELVISGFDLSTVQLGL